jgi:DNA mismatch endonuclease (patch repair protein)
MDTLSPERRSWNMSRIKSGDTGPELIVRSILHRIGCRFSLHRKDLAGRPDVVLPKYKTVVFVHGCFWHRHKGCQDATMPKTRRAFWRKKLEGNVARDKVKQCALRTFGWRVIVVWECETEDTRDLRNRLQRIFTPKPARGYTDSQRSH